MDGLIAILNQLNIIVGDMHASIDFYRRLGVQIPEAAGNKQPAPFHVNAETAGGFKFEFDSAQFSQVWNAGWVGRDDLAGRIVLGFHFKTRGEIDKTYQELTEAGYKGLATPFDAFWGARSAIVEDPNGIAVGLMSPIEPDRRLLASGKLEALIALSTGPINALH
jgi:uncharacterized glyoxalase superfamily protein PhnB